MRFFGLRQLKRPEHLHTRVEHLHAPAAAFFGFALLPPRGDVADLGRLLLFRRAYAKSVLNLFAGCLKCDFLIGKSIIAGGGARTHTTLRPLDFESSASANSATPALLGKCSLFCRFLLPVFYFLFYFDEMQGNAGKSRSALSAVKVKRPVKHRYRFTIVKDSRNRKVRGLWRRGEKLYMQTRVSGEKSARKIPLKATTLEAAREEMADLKKQKRIEGLPDTGLRPLFSQYADKYLYFHRTASDSGKKARTIHREEHSLVHWKGAVGNIRLDKITTPMITSVIKTRLAAGIKPRTVNIDVIVLRNVLNEAKDDGLIVRLPTDGIKPRKVKTPVRPLLTPADFTQLCKAAADCGKNQVQVLDYIRLLAYSGARRDEALALKWGDVNFERKFLRIGADGSTKNSKARYVDFNPELEAHLKDMAARRVPDSEWLFPSPHRGDKDTPAKTFRDSFTVAREKAKLPWVGFHDLRHYFASMAVMAGIDFKTIAEWLGHQDGGMLVGKVYGHLLPEHRKRMAERLVFTPSVVTLADETSQVSAC